MVFHGFRMKFWRCHLDGFRLHPKFRSCHLDGFPLGHKQTGLSDFCFYASLHHSPRPQPPPRPAHHHMEPGTQVTSQRRPHTKRGSPGGVGRSLAATLPAHLGQQGTGAPTLGASMEAAAITINPRATRHHAQTIKEAPFVPRPEPPTHEKP